MRLRSLAAFLIVFAPAAFASDAANTARGLAPNSVSGGGDIDHINVFNGNLLINIPLPAFPLDGGASYRLHLVYTGQPWDFVKDYTPQNTYKQIPNRRSNAGLAWRVSLGRIILPSDVTNPTNTSNSECPSCAYVYESPDGADHVFYNRLHPSDTTTADFYYTRDNTFFRLQIIRTSGAITGFQLEFADGMRHLFDTLGRITKIYTPHDPANSPSVTITYHDVSTGDTATCNDAGAQSCWKITDRFARTQRVTFSDTSRYYSGLQLRKIIVPAFGGTTTTYTATYNNGESDVNVWTDRCSYARSSLTPTHYPLPVLTGLSVPDGSQYTMTVHNIDTSGGAESCAQGSLDTLTLPTRGKLRYTYADYAPRQEDDLTTPSLAGVATRSLVDTNGATSVWTYQLQLGDVSPPRIPPAPPCQTCSQYRDRTVTIITPDKHQFVHYFSLASHSVYSDSTEWKRNEYALPLTHRTGTSVTGADNVTRYLSTEVYSGTTNSNGVPQLGTVKTRSTYVRYERDGADTEDRAADDNRRLQSTMTVFHDDPASGTPRYALSASSDYDGLGHYRTTTTSGNFAGSNERTTTTAFNKRDTDVNGTDGVPNVGTYDATNNGAEFTMIASTAPWVLGTYTSRLSTEGGQTQKEQFCFAADTGQLRRRRVLTGDETGGIWSGTTISRTDIIQQFTYETSTGNLAKEEYFGGDPPPPVAADQTSLPSRSVPTTGKLCDMSIGTPTYELAHTYNGGVRRSTRYNTPGGGSIGYNILDHSDSTGGSGVDANTGLVAFSRDTAGVVTKYVYDALRRLTNHTAAFGCVPTSIDACPAGTSYQYNNATEAGPATIDIARGSTSHQTVYDGFGRLTTEWQYLQNAWRKRLTTYTSDGQKKTVSTWGFNPTAVTTFAEYDAFGRPGKITGPDGLTTTITYAGVSTLTRKVRVALTEDQPHVLTDASTRETYDRFGRLHKVEEPNTLTGLLDTPASTTTYTYDVGNRLATVAMGAGNGTTAPVQTRAFRYDGRGYLRSETHPELARSDSSSGDTVKYGGYDARGHVGTKELTTASPYDLTYFYDNAEHLTRINARQGTTATFRASKRFTYANANNGTSKTAGKLTSSTRHNYFDTTGMDQIDVVETYAYSDGPGRLTGKSTTLWQGSGTPQTFLKQLVQQVGYDDLDAERYVWYPQCPAPSYCGRESALITNTYTNGALSGVAGLETSGIIAYGANNTVETVTHGNGIVDTYTSDSTGLQRPSSIKFETYSGCTAPSIIEQPAANPTVLPDGRVTLIVDARGTSIAYQWYREVVANQWDKISGATGSTYQTPTLTSAAKYRVTIYNPCGTITSATSTVSITPHPAPTGVVATWNGAANITVTWTSESAVHHYQIERRYDNGYTNVVEIINNVTSPYTHTPVIMDHAYVYRVRAADSADNPYAFSTGEIATSKNFSAPIAGTTLIAKSYLDDLLTLVNIVRWVKHDAALTWTTAGFLASGVPAPTVGGEIYAGHLAALRTAMNNALTAVNVPTTGYVADPLTGAEVKASHITDISNRAQ